MRIRTVKPSFFKDEELAKLPPLCRIFFQGLWSMADGIGRLEERPEYLKIEILPYDECDVESFLKLLATPKRHGKHGFIIRYQVEGVPYLQVTNFTKNQRISGKEFETESEIPAPPRETMVKQSGNNGETAIVQEGKGKEGKGRERIAIEIPIDLLPIEPKINEWLTYKREKGQTYKPMGLKALWRRLEAIPAATRGPAIDYSMAQNYSGIFEQGGKNGAPKGGVAGEPGIYDKVKKF
jgi:hypothetical protein